jgi:hypothetical protein
MANEPSNEAVWIAPLDLANPAVSQWVTRDWVLPVREVRELQRRRIGSYFPGLAPSKATDHMLKLTDHLVVHPGPRQGALSMDLRTSICVQSLQYPLDIG